MGKLLIPAQRHERIREYLEVHRVARTADLCEMLGVSEATVRRDLEYMEAQGILERTHGGAILTQRVPLAPEYAHRARTRTDEKRSIGALAASLIEDGDVIFINGGTTCTQVVSHIRNKPNVTVVTNNVMAALEASNADFRLILLGGLFVGWTNSVAGPFAVEMVRQIYADKAFIGVEGISPKFGCTVPSEDEAQLVREMIRRTRGPVTVVADHSKWGAVSNFEVAPLSRIHRLITDGGLDASARAELAAHSVEVLIADRE